MKVFSSNLVGTQQNSFRVGKKQFTLYTGTDNPNIITPTTQDGFNIGDKYHQKNIIGEWIWDGGVWKFIGGLIVADETNLNTTASLNNILPVDTTSGIVDIAPPLNPVIGTRFAIVDSRYNSEENYIRVLTSTDLLYGGTDDFIINKNGATVMFLYISTSVGWTVT